MAFRWLLNNDRRHFERERVAPRHGFEPRFTALRPMSVQLGLGDRGSRTSRSCCIREEAPCVRGGQMHGVLLFRRPPGSPGYLSHTGSWNRRSVPKRELQCKPAASSGPKTGRSFPALKNSIATESQQMESNTAGERAFWLGIASHSVTTQCGWVSARIAYSFSVLRVSINASTA